MSTTVPTAPTRRTMHNIQDVIDDVEWLIRAGESREQIATRLGYTSTGTLARVLHRAGRHDLARAFGRKLEVAR